MQATKNKKKTKITAVIGELVVIVILLTVLGSFLLKEMQLGKAPAVATATPAPAETSTPEPVDLRSYAVHLPAASEECVTAALETAEKALRAEFDSSFDGSESAALTVSGQGVESEKVYSLILTVSYPGEERTEYHHYSRDDGREMTLEDIYGENIREYLADYFAVAVAAPETVVIVPETSLTLPTESEAAENGTSPTETAETAKPAVLIGERVVIEARSEEERAAFSPDFAVATGADSPYFDCFTVGEDGLLHLFFPEGALYTDGGAQELTVEKAVSDGELFRLRRIYPARPMVAVTFDDGPSDVYTDQILQILDDNHAVATFFDVGVHVQDYPEVERRVVLQGSEVASHTYWHINLRDSSYGDVMYDKEKADAAFTAALGYVPRLIRPPEGNMGGGVYDQIYIGWSVDTLDWLNKNPGLCFKTVKQFGNLDGQVILLHAIYDTSVEAARQIFPWLAEQGYQMVTVSELLEYCYGLPQPNTGYYYAYDFFVHGRPVPEAAEA